MNVLRYIIRLIILTIAFLAIIPLLIYIVMWAFDKKAAQEMKEIFLNAFKYNNDNRDKI